MRSGRVALVQLGVLAALLAAWEALVASGLLIGIGVESKVVLAVSICGIVAWISAFDAIRSVDLDHIDMVRALGGGRWDAFTKIVVPTSLTWVSATMKINVGLALIGAITGEYLSSTRGLGYLAVKTANEYQMSHTLGVLMVIAVIAAAQYYLLGRLESRIFRWQADAGLVHIT